jgi:hypothetical protein
LTNEELPAAMQHQTGLLLFGFYRHETNRRPRYRFTDRGGIVGVVLVAFEIGLHVARWHQLDRVAESLKFSAPMVCARAGFNANKAGRQGREKLQPLRTANPLADHHRAISIRAVNLEYRLRNIETNCANLAHGRLPFNVVRFDATTLGTSMQ